MVSRHQHKIFSCQTRHSGAVYGTTLSAR